MEDKYDRISFGRNEKYKLTLNTNFLQYKKGDEFIISHGDGYFEPEIIIEPYDYHLSKLIDLIGMEENLFTRIKL